jgi:formylglycine-generating enzyme required for sulfatase activity
MTPISANADWTPVEQDFDGIVMVLVPAGCFPMGRDSVSSGEAPEHEQCFDAPFWIDKTEITNAQFALYENVAELLSTNRRDDAPRDNISLREAATYCAMREGRLPTEREWEYAASGPSNLVYPWGDEWVGGYAVWERTSQDRSELAGSRPQNTSWVGAIDLSGNVWEWTSTIDRAYPYDAEDGREASDDVGSPRIIRGGSWANQPQPLTTSFRLGIIPTTRDAKIGFRCVRDAA